MRRADGISLLAVVLLLGMPALAQVGPPGGGPNGEVPPPPVDEEIEVIGTPPDPNLWDLPPGIFHVVIHWDKPENEFLIRLTRRQENMVDDFDLRQVRNGLCAVMEADLRAVSGRRGRVNISEVAPYSSNLPKYMNAVKSLMRDACCML